MWDMGVVGSGVISGANIGAGADPPSTATPANWPLPTPADHCDMRGVARFHTERGYNNRLITNSVGDERGSARLRGVIGEVEANSLALRTLEFTPTEGDRLGRTLRGLDALDAMSTLATRMEQEEAGQTRPPRGSCETSQLRPPAPRFGMAQAFAPPHRG